MNNYFDSFDCQTTCEEFYEKGDMMKQTKQEFIKGDIVKITSGLHYERYGDMNGKVTNASKYEGNDKVHVSVAGVLTLCDPSELQLIREGDSFEPKQTLHAKDIEDLRNNVIPKYIDNETYVIENNGIGSYECHGYKGFDSGNDYPVIELYDEMEVALDNSDTELDIGEYSGSYTRNINEQDVKVTYTFKNKRNRIFVEFEQE
jgi:hypothetical protein